MAGALKRVSYIVAHDYGWCPRTSHRRVLRFVARRDLRRSYMGWMEVITPLIYQWARHLQRAHHMVSCPCVEFSLRLGRSCRLLPQPHMIRLEVGPPLSPNGKFGPSRRFPFFQLGVLVLAFPAIYDSVRGNTSTESPLSAVVAHPTQSSALASSPSELVDEQYRGPKRPSRLLLRLQRRVQVISLLREDGAVDECPCRLASLGVGVSCRGT